MASALAPAITPDEVVSFEINPGTLPQLLETRAEGGARLKCFEGSVTLVSPGRSHESAGARLDLLILAVCQELKIRREALRSTTWASPFGVGDTAYEADNAYYLERHGTADPQNPPDLAIEVVVSHPETKALRAGALLKIPELWVLDLPGRRLTFYHLVTRGKSRGAYRRETTSRAFPLLTSAAVIEQLDDPETDDTAFLQNCRDWVLQLLHRREKSV
jgi:Uma2 family endonuclease